MLYPMNRMVRAKASARNLISKRVEGQSIEKIGLGKTQRRIVFEVVMILDDMRHAIRSTRHLLRVRFASCFL